MQTASLDLEQFPDSPYAGELRRDFPDLRFAADLERDFQAFHLERMRTRVRCFQLAICLLSLTVALHLNLMDGLPLGRALAGWTGPVILMSLFLACASWGHLYGTVYAPAARVAMPVLGVVAAVGIAGHLVAGHPDPFYFLTSYSIALFFLSGQLFYQALLANALMVIAHGATLAYHDEPAPVIAYYVSVLTIIGLVGAFVYRAVERQLRTSFLERGLMSEMAARDGMTRLKNRGAFDDHFPRMWQQAARDCRPVALLLIDVDHFKAYNDRYGHQAGDEALRRVAQVVGGWARRPLDMAARYGGEEFVLALFDFGAEHVSEVAEELRQAIRALDILHEDSPTAKAVTASIGASVVSPVSGRRPQDAVQLADEALYQAKRTGRNRVVVVESDYEPLATAQARLRA